MPYDKKTIEQAEKKGIFENKLDPDVLSLEDTEKKKLATNLKKASKEMEVHSLKSGTSTIKKNKTRQLNQLYVKMGLLEKIYAFILAVFGIKSPEQYKIDKALKNVEKNLNRNKEAFFNSARRRVSAAFAYHLHEFYLELLWLKKLFENTLGNKQLWNNLSADRSVAELLFERLTGINSEEVSSHFSEKAIADVAKNYNETKSAVDSLEKGLYSYIYSIEKNILEQVNLVYTNLVYFKRLTEFDFISLFRRFDPDFNSGMSPSFMDIPGNGIVNYLSELEELIFQIDLTMDNKKVIRQLYTISQKLTQQEQIKSMESDDQNPPQNIEETPVPDNIGLEISHLIDKMKNLAYNKKITSIIQLVKKDPLYAPSFVHAKFDLYKIYIEILEKRVTTVARRTIKNTHLKKIEGIIHRLFPELRWVGIYNVKFSDELENSNYVGFSHPYQVAVMYNFLQRHYNELIKNNMNILLLNGNFTERNFQKMLSETFYNMDKFIERFERFCGDILPDGAQAKRLTKLLSHQTQQGAENRNNIEKNIVHINGQAKDFFEEFSHLFSNIATIISRVHADATNKPPKYVRNIRSIGGFRNSKFIQSLQKCNQIMEMMSSIMHSLNG